MITKTPLVKGTPIVFSEDHNVV